MKLVSGRSLAFVALLAAGPTFGQAPPQLGIAPVTLSGEPYVLDTAEQHKIKVSVLAKGSPARFAIEFLPGGDLLVSERGGGLRIIRQATAPGAALDPQPIDGNAQTACRFGLQRRLPGHGARARFRRQPLALFHL